MILLPTLQRCFGINRNIERAALWHWCTWHYSTQGLPTNTVTRNNRELLPHVFTLIQLMKARRLFSVALSVPVYHGSRQLTGVLPFAVRTFLPPFKGRTMTWLIDW